MVATMMSCRPEAVGELASLAFVEVEDPDGNVVEAAGEPAEPPPLAQAARPVAHPIAVSAPIVRSIDRRLVPAAARVFIVSLSCGSGSSAEPPGPANSAETYGTTARRCTTAFDENGVVRDRGAGGEPGRIYPAPPTRTTPQLFSIISCALESVHRAVGGVLVPARPTEVDARGPPDIFLGSGAQVPTCCPWPAAAGV